MLIISYQLLPFRAENFASDVYQHSQIGQPIFDVNMQTFLKLLSVVMHDHRLVSGTSWHSIRAPTPRLSDRPFNISRNGVYALPGWQAPAH
jgi:hypothetical protein